MSLYCILTALLTAPVFKSKGEKVNLHIGLVLYKKVLQLFFQMPFHFLFVNK